MTIKGERGVTGIDIIVSLIILTIFISLIANLIANINSNTKDTELKSKATVYAVDEIEKIKNQGYINEYDNKGISKEDIIDEKDINDEKNNFTGYHKKITIKDYVLIKNDLSKTSNLVKQITVEISYKVRNKDKSVQISTYIVKE